MSGPRACDSCLRRAWFVGSLTDRIDAVCGDRRGKAPLELLGLDDAELAAAVCGSRARPMLEKARARDVTRLRAAVRGSHCWACCRHGGAYPAQLLQLGDPPATLFGRGDVSLLEAIATGSAAITVVGSRRPSAYASEVAERLGRELGVAGAIVVSGMAFGIDSCAHRGALASGASTVAVLGGGADAPTPRGMSSLYEQIADSGLVLSELPPGTQPRPWTFPARNRIMAALSGMTVVVEARERSGSLITAQMASELGREVGAVPGQVGGVPAAGSNALLRDGAHLIRDGEDVLDSLLGIRGSLGRDRLRPPDPAEMLAPGLASVLDQVERGADSCDAVALACGIEPSEAAVALVTLELEGMIGSDSMGRYRRLSPGSAPGRG